jgi:hypothetical protein
MRRDRISKSTVSSAGLRSANPDTFLWFSSVTLVLFQVNFQRTTLRYIPEDRPAQECVKRENEEETEWKI